MNIEVRVINLKKAMRENKSKDVVKYKFQMYLQEYDNKEKSIRDKINHRDLFMDYVRYMSASGERNKK